MATTGGLIKGIRTDYRIQTSHRGTIYLPGSLVLARGLHGRGEGGGRQFRSSGSYRPVLLIRFRAGLATMGNLPRREIRQTSSINAL